MVKHGSDYEHFWVPLVGRHLLVGGVVRILASYLTEESMLPCALRCCWTNTDHYNSISSAWERYVRLERTCTSPTVDFHALRLDPLAHLSCGAHFRKKHQNSILTKASLHELVRGMLDKFQLWTPVKTLTDKIAHAMRDQSVKYRRITYYAKETASNALRSEIKLLLQ